MSSSGLKFGSDEWRSHMRRSLAQRKRHGEKIDDIEGLITYIEKKGPAKQPAIAKPAKKKATAKAKVKPKLSKPAKRTSVVKNSPLESRPGIDGLYSSPRIMKVR